MQLSRVLYGDTMWSTNMAIGNQLKHLEFTLRWKRLLLARGIKYMIVYEHISLCTWKTQTAEIHWDRPFFFNQN